MRAWAWKGGTIFELNANNGESVASKFLACFRALGVESCSVL